MSKKQLSKLGLAALAVISIAERRLGRLWARPHIMARNSTGAFAKLLPVLREREPSQFRNFLRMPVTTFDWLLTLVVAPICHFCAVFLGSRDVTSRGKSARA